MTVPVQGSGAAFHASTPAPLFKLQTVAGPGTPFDVTRDGKRIIALVPLPSRLPPSLQLIFDWKALLPQR